MPQMAPIWWTMLSMMFLLSMMMSMQMLYFNYNKFFKKKNLKNKINYYWVW
uniref:ATP synthase F0 subunit 8 n=1 Tax=Eurhadina exclamationis TaxID=2892960 RepID=A0A9E6XSU1_9HEMI|nr:ATP synthase F0 subunit 8 [Eurhadina exclamationis]UGN61501.1 ATP synthase F0 subunit 8 [Eurhadina exclamationis]